MTRSEQIKFIHIGMLRSAKLVENMSEAGDKSKFALAIKRLAQNEGMKANQMYLEGKI
jgi:hypothetical protein